MKITIRCILINISKEAEFEINRLITVFLSAKRYGLNIRQSKGAL